MERGHLLGRLHRENFRRGGYLAQGDRYERARTFLATATELWDSWHGDEILADSGTGQFLATTAPGTFRHRDAFFDIAGQFNVPRSPQGRPVIFQAGDSDKGRDFAAASADAIFSRYSTLEAGRAFYADVKGLAPGRPYPRRAADPARGHVRARRYRRRGGRDRP